MSSRLFDWGRDGFLNSVCSWTGHTQKAMLVDLTVADVGIKAITAASNANPVVYTCAAHGFSIGDVVVVGNVGGNLSANQTGQVAAASFAAGTFSLVTLEGIAVQGSAAYTSGGYAVDLTLAKFVADVSAGREGTDIAVGGTASARGVATSSNFTWLGVPVGNPVQAVIIYDNNTAVEATDRIEAFIDGKIRVVVDTAALATAVTLRVEPLKGPISNGTTINFSDGTAATTNAVAAMGDRSITTTALAANIAQGATADVSTTSSGLPVTPNGGNITFTVGSLYGPGGSTTPGFTVTGIFELLAI